MSGPADTAGRIAAWLWVRSLRTQQRPDRPWMRRLSRAFQAIACAMHRDPLSYCCERHRGETR